MISAATRRAAQASTVAPISQPAQANAGLGVSSCRIAGPEASCATALRIVSWTCSSMFHPDVLFSAAYTTAQAPHTPDLRRGASGKVTADWPRAGATCCLQGFLAPFIDVAGGAAVSGFRNPGACPGAE